MKRPGDEGYGQASQYGEDRDTSGGWGEEDDGWGRSTRGIYGDDDGYGGYDDVRIEGASNDWERPGKERERMVRPVPMQDGSLRDGDEVTARYRMFDPLDSACQPL